MCQIGVMTCYRLHSIRFERRCVSDWCDDWLQALRYKFELRCVSDLCDDWLKLHNIRPELRCVCQIGVMTGYRLYGISIQLWCVSDWCDDRLQPLHYTV